MPAYDVDAIMLAVNQIPYGWTPLCWLLNQTVAPVYTRVVAAALLRLSESKQQTSCEQRASATKLSKSHLHGASIANEDAATTTFGCGTVHIHGIPQAQTIRFPPVVLRCPMVLQPDTLPTLQARLLEPEPEPLQNF
jgi:hypothetical protein